MYLNTKTSLDYGSRPPSVTPYRKLTGETRLRNRLSNIAHSLHAESVFVVSSNRTCVCEVGRFGEVIRCDEIVTLRGRLRRPPSYRPPGDATSSQTARRGGEPARLKLRRILRHQNLLNAYLSVSHSAVASRG